MAGSRKILFDVARAVPLLVLGLLASIGCGSGSSKKVENTVPLCSDGIDNDGDGHVDCDDQDCQVFAVCHGDGGPDSDTDVDTDVDTDSDTATDTDTDTNCVRPEVECFGECVNLGTDPQNCGGCGVECSDGARAPACVAGDCACTAVGESCAGTMEDTCCETEGAYGCIDASSDTQNCGGCGEECDKDEPCVDGECVLVHPQCLEDYAEFDRADRNVDFNDGDGGVEYCDFSDTPITSPDWDGDGWYRFVGDAGVRMPEEAPAIYACGTDAPGWLNGAHPTAEEGVVDRTVCFNWEDDTCHVSTGVQVVNCGGFFLYYLTDRAWCHSRYCGEDG